MKTKEKEVDIIIVGAGASGAAAAWNLSKTNYKICLFRTRATSEQK